MAEFCKQCAKELFGTDKNDMSGRVTPENYIEGFVGTGLCEGCSGGEFDPDGACQGGCENPTHTEPRVLQEEGT